MKEPVLILIKPDAVKKNLLGTILTKLSEARLDILALKTCSVTTEQAKQHYKHIEGTPFFEGVVKYLSGQYHKQSKVVLMILFGEAAIRKCRKLAGKTNPEEADPTSIRGAYGRITSDGLYENLIHVSSGKKEAKEEIQLWFEPKEISKKLYPTKSKTIKNFKKEEWK